MRVLVCGDRNWSHKAIIQKILSSIKPDVVIEGEARGADSMAREVAESLEIVVEKYPANWEKYGKSAGMVRNTQMLKEGKPDLVLAFHDDIENSKGTKNMVAQARKAGIETVIIRSFSE